VKRIIALPLLGLILTSVSAAADNPPLANGAKPNILFIAVDDLRPELGCYGSEIVQSPTLDKLAAEGMRFERAYCQQAICSPSRASLMTGCRPETIGVIENRAYFRELNPNITTLPQYLVANSYESVYCGKIFHGRMTDDDHSWSRRPAWNKVKLERPAWKNGGYLRPENQAIFHRNRQAMLAKYGEGQTSGLIHGPAYEYADVPDHAYPDGFNTRLAIATLKEHLEKKPDTPLFLGLGFHKPHLDFIAPKRYWDLYDPGKIRLATHDAPPKDGAAVGLHASFELRVRDGIPKSGPIPEDLARTLLHGYYACVSYVDAQIGLMLEALDEAGVRDNTIIVVWGDHGWHLGDMGVWGKATNYEIATRVPLIVWTPDMKSRGQASQSIVELLDLYPTLCDLAGLPVPAHCAGKSFRAILDDPQHKGKSIAVSQFPSPALREWAANPLSSGMRETFFGPLINHVEGQIMAQVGDQWDRELFEKNLMGYALRTDRYRFVVWRDRRDENAAPIYVELYDHSHDPDETVNIALQHPLVVARLTAQLRTELK
jgi:iduronate 2-sulfatase